ncbi:MAG TPA: hypothetical protein VHH13_10545 [Arthrobacter sp.]|nr:hypothetical protein [Arthrobacter sp.]
MWHRQLTRPEILSPEEWSLRAQEHQRRAARFTDPYLQRRSAGRKHPVEDFLFTYYSHKPGQLLRWHPGAGVVLTGEAAMERHGWKYYRPLSAQERAALEWPAGDLAESGR